MGAEVTRTEAYGAGSAFPDPSGLGTWDPATPTVGPLGDLAQASRELPEGLLARLVQLAHSPTLLVATDYDGTIAPLVDRPTHAFPLPISVASMRSLAALPDTDSAVISGRALRDLAAMSRLPREVTLLGSHGIEDSPDTEDFLSPAARTLLTRIRERMNALLAQAPALLVEAKPTGVAVHLRGLGPDIEDLALRAVAEVESWEGVTAVHGKDVVDLSVVPTSKARALAQLRGSLRDPAVVYIGDDTSDEAALATLGDRDLGIRVGTPEAALAGAAASPAASPAATTSTSATAASFTVADPQAVALVLSSLFELRRAWLFGSQSVPIERHSLLGNGHSLALVDAAGRIVWMPYPLPHSAAIFAEILGSRQAGYFSVAAADGARPLTQRYRTNSMVLETRWPGLNCHDYFAPASTPKSADAVLVRELTGDAPAQIRFAPRPDFGATPVRLELIPGGVRVLTTSEPITLYAPGVRFRIEREPGAGGIGGSDTAVATVVPANEPGERVVLALALGGEYEEPGGVLDELFSGPPAHLRHEVHRASRDWVASLELPDLHQEAVVRSALTLRALCHEPTGGALAAATSSLPEGLGGVRNWDYRYCWLRDGSMTVRTLLELGSTKEAVGFLDWLTGILAGAQGPEQLHPLYAVDGSALTTEAVLGHLPGYAGSRPVRVGNAAEHQVQLDVFGPVTELLLECARTLGELRPEHWELTRQMVLAVSRRWEEPDHGIWEARRAPKHNVYTKVMCWVTADRAVRIAEEFGKPVPGTWIDLREAIAADVLDKGFNRAVGAFTVAYGEDDLDAAALFVGLSGLLPGDDPRFVATVDAVERDLRAGPTVFRYHYADGLPGLEGGFHICTSWLIEALALVGRTGDALDLFERLHGLLGPTGMLPEEYDPVAETHLGNTPQAYSHLGYIRCARLLDDVLARAGGPQTEPLPIIRPQFLE